MWTDTQTDAPKKYIHAQVPQGFSKHRACKTFCLDASGSPLFIHVPLNDISRKALDWCATQQRALKVNIDAGFDVFAPSGRLDLRTKPGRLTP